jgi:hypothetical protein
MVKMEAERLGSSLARHLCALPVLKEKCLEYKQAIEVLYKDTSPYWSEVHQVHFWQGQMLKS